MLYPASFGDNPLYPKDTDFRVIRKDDTNGFGVISLRSFKRGEIVATMAGEVVTDIRQHILQIDDESHLRDIYFLRICLAFVLAKYFASITIKGNSRMMNAEDSQRRWQRDDLAYRGEELFFAGNSVSMLAKCFGSPARQPRARACGTAGRKTNGWR